jgi:hypothetical protein
VSLGQDENLVFQSFYTSMFLLELDKNKFIYSDYYKMMEFSYPRVKEELSKSSIGNQGTILMVLYSLLVVPRELLENKYRNEFLAVDKGIAELINSDETLSTYKGEGELSSIRYSKHIRNAVSHASVNFHVDTETVENRMVIFSDKNQKNEECTITIPLARIIDLVFLLLDIHKKYLEDIHRQNPQ